MFNKELKWQNATDLTWLNPTVKLIHLKQPLFPSPLKRKGCGGTLKDKEYGFYAPFRTEGWENDYCYFNGVA